MPYLGILKTPYFDGQNVTDFLDHFSDLYVDYKLSDKEKIKQFPWYCDMRISQSIKTIQEWQDRDWKRFQKLLCKEYESADQAQTYYLQEFLETFKDQIRGKDKDLWRFCKQYTQISEELVQKNHLDNFTKILWFVQGPPGLIWTELFLHSGINMDELEKVDFNTLLSRALMIAKGNRRLRRITNYPFKRERLSHLADLCDSKPKWNSSASDEDFFVPPVVPSTQTLVTSSNSADMQRQAQRMKDNSMDFLTRKFDAMTLALQAQLARSLQTVCVSAVISQPASTQLPGNLLMNPAALPFQINLNSYICPDSFQFVDRTYNYCREYGHIWRYCWMLR